MSEIHRRVTSAAGASHPADRPRLAAAYLQPRYWGEGKSTLTRHLRRGRISSCVPLGGQRMSQHGPSPPHPQAFGPESLGTRVAQAEAHWLGLGRRAWQSTVPRMGLAHTCTLHRTMDMPKADAQAGLLARGPTFADERLSLRLPATASQGRQRKQTPTGTQKLAKLLNLDGGRHCL